MKASTTLKQWLVAALVGFLSIACNRAAGDTQSAAADCQTISHLMGETQVCGQPQKIAVLGPSFLEALLSLEMQPAGVADYFKLGHIQYNNPVQQIPYLGDRVTSQPASLGQSFTPSLEALLKLKPDLIVGASFNQAQYQAFSDIAPTLLLDWYDVETNLRSLAQAVRRPQIAEKLIVNRQKQIAAAREAFAPTIAAHPKMLLLNSAEMQEFHLISRQDSCGSLIESLGFQLIYPLGWDADNLRSSTLSLEALPQLDGADSIIVFGESTHNFDPFQDASHFEQQQLQRLQQAWQKNAIAQSLPAAQAKRVYFIPTYLCRALPGPIGTELYLSKLKQQLLPSR